MRGVFFVLVLVISTSTFGQLNKNIEGKISNKETGEPIPYANLYNHTSGNGTISNLDGYFTIKVNSVKDSIAISYIGFNNQTISLESGKRFYEIYLSESPQLLTEIVISPKDDSFLFDLIDVCKKNQSDLNTTSKAYWELKSYRDDTQMEMVEGFYNAQIKGYELQSLELKTSRLAIRSYQDRLFGSLESSRAITMLKSLDRNRYFPDSPLTLPKRKAKKNYYLYLEKKYLSQQGDSIYVIEYQPKNQGRPLFNGQIWINKTRRNFLKITSGCTSCISHPFLPLFPSDSISSVDLNISKTFQILNNQMVFNHIDFSYKVDYNSRISEPHESSYSIKSNAVLYVYDHLNTFFIPVFSFNSPFIGDFRKINAMPYNHFFWENHDEYKTNDQLKLNEKFFNDPNSLTNQVAFQSNQKFERGLIEHPFVHWSPERVSFREVSSDTLDKSPYPDLEKESYKLAVKIFLDINHYNDSTDILTATVFDPYDSYFYLPLDEKTNCFINIYFDLCEIQRKKLESDLKLAVTKGDPIEPIIHNFYFSFEEQKFAYFKSAKLGKNESEMVKWNDLIIKSLGIDNFEIFNPFPEKK